MGMGRNPKDPGEMGSEKCATRRAKAEEPLAE